MVFSVHVRYVVRPSVCRLSVTFVRHCALLRELKFSAMFLRPFATLAIC